MLHFYTSKDNLAGIGDDNSEEQEVSKATLYLTHSGLAQIDPMMTRMTQDDARMTQDDVRMFVQFLIPRPSLETIVQKESF